MFDRRTEGEGLAGVTCARCMTDVCQVEVGCASCWPASLSWLGSCPHPRESMGGEISTPMARFTARFWPPCPLLLGRDSSAWPEQSSRPRPLGFLSSGRGDTPRTQGEVRRRHFPSGLTKLTPCHCPASPRRPQRVGCKSPQRRGFKGRAALFKARGNAPKGAPPASPCGKGFNAEG